jgi:hypothetical protein
MSLFKNKSFNIPFMSFFHSIGPPTVLKSVWKGNSPYWAKIILTPSSRCIIWHCCITIKAKMTRPAGCMKSVWKSGGETHPDTLLSMTYLALFYHSTRQGQYDQTCPLLENMRSLRGENYPNTFGSMNNAASLYNKQGRYQNPRNKGPYVYLPTR